MLELSERQRELTLCRYFQNHTQRAAASLVGCSESVASRELATAIEKLRRFFARRGVTVSAAALIALLSAHAARAAICNTAISGALASASSAAESSVTTPLFLMLMNATSKIVILGVAALLLSSGTVYYFTHHDEKVTTPPGATNPGNASAAVGQSAPEKTADAPQDSKKSVRPVRSLSADTTRAPKVFDDAALKEARDKGEKFLKRLGELAIITDPAKVQTLLASEFGIVLTVDEITHLQKNGPKGFMFGVIDLWAGKQPQEALAWAATVAEEPNRGGANFYQPFLDAARRSLPGLDRQSLAQMLPDGPGTAAMLDLIDASNDPAALGNRILNLTDPEARLSQLQALAKGWDKKETALAWGRQNLNGAERSAFYESIAYELAHENPQSALQVLDELKGTEQYASAFGRMMRGLVQLGGQGAQAAALIENANLSAEDRAGLISELARRWVRSDPDATVAWANTLKNPEDFHAAIPLLVSQLDNDRVSQTVETYLKNPDPTMELALIEAAAPDSLRFDPDKSHLILDPLIAHDPNMKIVASEGKGQDRSTLLWNAINMVARLQTEDGSASAALDWLAKLPFAGPGDYEKAVSNVLAVWNLKSEPDAMAWLDNSALNPAQKTNLRQSLSQTK